MGLWLACDICGCRRRFDPTSLGSEIPFPGWSACRVVSAKLYTRTALPIGPVRLWEPCMSSPAAPPCSTPSSLLWTWLTCPSGDHPRRVEGASAFLIASIRRHQPSFRLSAALMRSTCLYRSLTDSRNMIDGSVSSNSSTFLAGPLKNNRKKYFLLLPSRTIPQ